MKITYIIKNARLEDTIVFLTLQHLNINQENINRLRDRSTHRMSDGFPPQVIQMMSGGSMFQQADRYQSKLIISLDEYKEMNSPTIGQHIQLEININFKAGELGDLQK